MDRFFRMKKYFHPFLSGIIASLTLLVFYFVVMSILAGSLRAAFLQFTKLWYYMIPLVAGFGIQVGLFIKIRHAAKDNFSRKMMMTNTTTSTVGMIACCAHHATDILPFLGLAVISTVLVKYQTQILIIGIVSNILGIVYLLKILRKIGKID